MCADPKNEVEITPEMIEAGASVLWELEGEVSKEALAAAVFEAMALHVPLRRLERAEGQAVRTSGEPIQRGVEGSNV